jgi:hypothetical protein
MNLKMTNWVTDTVVVVVCVLVAIMVVFREVGALILIWSPPLMIMTVLESKNWLITTGYKTTTFDIIAWIIPDGHASCSSGL